MELFTMSTTEISRNVVVLIGFPSALWPVVFAQFTMTGPPT